MAVDNKNYCQPYLLIPYQKPDKWPLTTFRLHAYVFGNIIIMPKIEIILIDRQDMPSAGAGEAGTVGIAPAIRNAIVDATGIGLHTLPMLPNSVLA